MGYIYAVKAEADNFFVDKRPKWRIFSARITVKNIQNDVVDIVPNQEDNSNIVDKPNQKAKRKRRPKKELEPIENDSHDVIDNENDVQKPKKKPKIKLGKSAASSAKYNPQV